MENILGSNPVLSLRDNKKNINVTVINNSDNGSFDVNELMRQNENLAKENKTLSIRLEWAMSQLEIKDALLKTCYD